MSVISPSSFSGVVPPQKRRFQIGLLQVQIKRALCDECHKLGMTNVTHLRGQFDIR